MANTGTTPGKRNRPKTWLKKDEKQKKCILKEVQK